MIVIGTYRMFGVVSWLNDVSFNYEHKGAYMNPMTNTPLTINKFMKYNFNETYKWTKITRGMNDTL